MARHDNWSKKFTDRFFESLPKRGIKKEYDSATKWTAAATTALKEAAMTLPEGDQPEKFAVASRGHRDSWRRSEYLTVDVTGYDRASTAPPLLVAEHENSYGSLRIRYTAWKLLSIRAKYRVIVGYYNPKARKKAEAIDSSEAFFELVGKAHEESGVTEQLLAIAGNWRATPRKPTELRAAFETRLIPERK